MESKIGKRFEKIFVLSFSHKDNRGKKYYKCLCDCGKEKIIRGDCLNKTKSCGCIRISKLRELVTTHNSSRTRLYRIHKAIISRCYRKSAINYKLYGERGIRVCEDWLKNFMSFKKWAISSGYKDNLTIDRIDVNGNYCPENCRWSTEKEQANNRRSNRMLSFNKKTLNMEEWSDKTGVENYNIYNRLKRGWSIEKTLTTPVKHYEVNGVYRHINKNFDYIEDKTPDLNKNRHNM